jgi:hypothetical protein
MSSSKRIASTLIIPFAHVQRMVKLTALPAGRRGTRGLIANPDTGMPVQKRPPITASKGL